MKLSEQALSRFTIQHKMIRTYIDGLPPEAIYQRYNPDLWSIHETIAYLCRYQYVFLSRINKICTEFDPFFERYEPETDPELPFTIARTTGSLLHEIDRIRMDLVHFLKELPEHYDSRIGSHAILGTMKLSQWLEFFLLHESSQLFKIFKLSGTFFSSYMQNKIARMPFLLNRIDEIA
jgi:hypothetical protein